MMKYHMKPMDFSWVMAIVHCIAHLNIQYCHSQLNLTANIFLYWLRELEIFSCIGQTLTG